MLAAFAHKTPTYNLSGADRNILVKLRELMLQFLFRCMLGIIVLMFGRQ